MQRVHSVWNNANLEWNSVLSHAMLNGLTSELERAVPRAAAGPTRVIAIDFARLSLDEQSSHLKVGLSEPKAASRARALGPQTGRDCTRGRAIQKLHLILPRIFFASSRGVEIFIRVQEGGKFISVRPSYI